MKISLRLPQIAIIFLCLSILLAACQPAAATPAANVVWQISVTKSAIKETLHSVEAVTQYNGSSINVVHTQTPDSNNVYVIVNANVSKVGDQSETFDWQYLTVRDANGKTYPRLSNDSFLEQYKYTPRITGLELRLGDYTGWMAFEVPATAAKGTLTLVYTGSGSQQEITLKK